ncbi:DUF6671 family protein [Jiella mangrovi]|uniref:DUF6671 domain-containing protein n=1 Tax=Jiella mangrovi TaxID=2821407 RepID=A0ABS4BMD5_9HYPH|nr:DUF6671 family protein [Jiella mangrovi]MBP0617895.1 hypothetical protein [Jiella mangrovi]
MAPPAHYSLQGKRAALATMHGKERVIAPLLEGALGLHVSVPQGVDTDRFGTFSREIERTGSQLDAARRKILAAFDADPDADVAIASEGSFGPHPVYFFAALGSEIVVLQDRRSGLELIGRQADLKTNFGHVTTRSVDDAAAFAERIGFPEHGVIVIGTSGGDPAPERYLRKDVSSLEELAASVNEAIAACGEAHVEADMRAHRNPTRMRAIRRATVDLVRVCRSLCPRCARPGFVVTETLAGLPCDWCGTATNAVRAEVSVCAGCRYRAENPVAAAVADPGHCPRCNP